MGELNSLKKLVDYMKKNLAKGYTLESLKWALIRQGYTPFLVSRAMAIATKELAESAPKLKEKPVIKYQIIDEHDRPIIIKKSFWKRFF